MGVVKNGGFGDGGMTFTRLTSQHFLKVRGNTHLQVEFRKKKIQCPNLAVPPPTPASYSRTGLVRRAGGPEAWPRSRGAWVWTERGAGPGAVVQLGHVIRLRVGARLLPSVLSGWGPTPRGAEAQMKSGGRGGRSLHCPGSGRARDTHERTAC